MAKKNAFDFNLKDGTTAQDLQKIQIIQNHTIIRLLSLTTDTAMSIVNGAVINDYKSRLEKFVEIKEPVVNVEPTKQTNLKQSKSTSLLYQVLQ